MGRGGEGCGGRKEGRKEGGRDVMKEESVAERRGLLQRARPH